MRFHGTDGRGHGILAHETYQRLFDPVVLDLANLEERDVAAQLAARPLSGIRLVEERVEGVDIKYTVGEDEN